MSSWYITTKEQKESFWNSYPFISLEYSNRLPNPNTYKYSEWKVPVPSRDLKLVKDSTSHKIQELKYISFIKTKVTFALPNENLTKMFIWVQEGTESKTKKD